MGPSVEVPMVRGLLLALLALSSAAPEVKHRFLASDGETSKLIYVDQFHPENDWTLETPKGPRDIKLRGDDLLISHRSGIAIYDFKTRERKRLVEGFKDVQSAHFLDGGDVLFVGMTEKGITIHTIDVSSKERPRIVVEGRHSVRNVRALDNGNFLMTCGPADKKSAIEIDRSGKVVWEVSLPGPADHIDRLDDGRTVVPSGSGGTAIYLDRDGKIVATRGGKDAHPDLKINWIASTQTLKNGNLVVTNWLGHKPGKTGPHAIEFDADNKVVWTWEDAGRVQTLHNILILE